MIKSYFHINIIIFIICLTRLASLPLISISQDNTDFKFDRLTSENVILEKGLSQNWIYTMLQDKQGYMWFGTWEGLNKYDGYNFTVYNVAHGLSNQTIYSLLEDDEGIIWIGTEKGFNKFDRKTQSFKQYHYQPSDSTSNFQNRINTLMQSKDGSIWLGTADGLFKFDKKNETFKQYFSEHQEYSSPRSNFILHLCEDANGIIWVATTFGLIRFDPKTQRSTRYYHVPGDSNSLSHNNVRYIMQEKSGNFWIGTIHGLNYFDTTTQELTQYFHDPSNLNSISGNWIRVIHEDSNGDVWIGTDDGGLNLYNAKTKEFIRYQNVLNDKSSLSNNRVYSIYEDNSGNIWVGTFNGVNRINKYFNDFKHCQQTEADHTSLNNNIVWSFIEDSNENLWIGTSEGISIKDPRTNTFTFLSTNPNNKISLGGNDVRAMFYSAESNCMWLGIRGDGMDKYDITTETITHYVPDVNRNSISSSFVNDLIKDMDGIIWIATGNGLNQYNPEINEFKLYKNQPNDTTSLSHNIAISLLQDRYGNIWIGTDKGLNKYDKANDNFTRYLFNPNLYNTTKGNTIFYLYEDLSGIIWVGTSGNGLFRLNPKNGQVKSYTTKNGLPNNVIYGIIEDDKSNLWISTNYGISKFSPENEQFVNYDVKDGLQSNEFNLGACYRDKEGRLYFGGMNGYNVFNPANIRYNPIEPVVVFSAFRKFNELQPTEYLDGDTIRLHYEDNFFSIEISALEFTNPFKNKYRYKLDNIDKDWIYVDASSRRAEYKKVRPGIYTFLANGTNNDGTWNDHNISLTIIINPAWYNTWLFRIFVLILIISTIWFLVYRRVRRIQQKHEVEKKMLKIEKQMYDLEQNALRLQMNPHFIFNSLNSIQSYIVTHNTDKAVKYLGKFSQLMRLILANSGNKYIPFKDEIKSIRYYIDLEKQRFEDKFEYNINIDSKIDEEFVEIPPMIIQPYIENAIIHGLIHKRSIGLLDIRFKLKGTNIICTIEDNGVGREKAAQLSKQSGLKRKSRGMLITKARLEILNRESNEEFSVKIEDLKDSKENPTGTKVKLIIHFKED